MSNFAWGFLAGFVSAAAVAVGWFHGSLKPRLDALKQMAADKLMGK